MTESDVKDFADFYAAQCNVSVAVAAAAISPWQHRFVPATVAELQECFLSLSIEEKLPRTHNERLSAILRRFRGQRAAKTATASYPANDSATSTYSTWCQRCFDGVIYVPHIEDYALEFWKGEHFMTVRCMCNRGNKYPKWPDIDHYERLRPNWKQEVPIRRLEWQMKIAQHNLEEAERTNSVNQNYYEKRLRDVMYEYDIYIDANNSGMSVKEFLLWKKQPQPQGVKSDDSEESQARESGFVHGEAYEEDANHSQLAGGLSFP